MSRPQYRLSRSLPRAIREYIGLPTRLAIGWIVFTGVGLFVLRSMLPPASAQQVVADAARSLPASLSEPSTILAVGRRVTTEVSGGQIVIERGDGDVVTATWGGERPLRIVSDANEARLVDAEDLARYRLVLVDPSKAKIFDASGALLWRVKREVEGPEETFKLYDDSDTIRHRVKVKADSFNVYASGSARIAKGKPRDGGFESRRESGGTDAIVSGDTSLRRAAVLSMPVEPAVRVLLWLLAGG